MMVPLVLLIVHRADPGGGLRAQRARGADLPGPARSCVPLIPSIVLSVLPVKAQLWMYAVPLLGQQLAIMRLLRGEPLSALALALSAVVTMLVAAGRVPAGAPRLRFRAARDFHLKRFSPRRGWRAEGSGRRTAMIEHDAPMAVVLAPPHGVEGADAAAVR